ncbi:MAG: glycosyltransferase family 2 protein [Planctomycetota bacterium]
MAYALSIVIPALNEQDNVGPLVDEVQHHVRGADPPVDAELIVIDDGSTDDTRPRLQALQAGRPWLRVLSRPTPQGQSSAMAAGIAAANAPLIATLDADLQNDPAELPAMMRMLLDQGLDLVQGDRSADRQDTAVRRYASGIGRKARLWVLGDRIRDTGCSARVVKTELVRNMPLHFKGMHRFFPAYAALQGARIGEMPVRHRARAHGQSKYGLGLLNRGSAGLFDLFAVRWMRKRYRPIEAQEVFAAAETDAVPSPHSAPAQAAVEPAP